MGSFIPSALVWGALADADLGCLNCAAGDFSVGTAMAGFVAGGLVGAGIGALIGAPFKSDRWEPVSLDRARMSVMPRLDGGLVLGMVLWFWVPPWHLAPRFGEPPHGI